MLRQNLCFFAKNKGKVVKKWIESTLDFDKAFGYAIIIYEDGDT